MLIRKPKQTAHLWLWTGKWIKNYFISFYVPEEPARGAATGQPYQADGAKSEHAGRRPYDFVRRGHYRATSREFDFISCWLVCLGSFDRQLQIKITYVAILSVGRWLIENLMVHDGWTSNIVSWKILLAIFCICAIPGVYHFKIFLFLLVHEVSFYAFVRSQRLLCYAQDPGDDFFAQWKVHDIRLSFTKRALGQPQAKLYTRRLYASRRHDRRQILSQLSGVQIQGQLLLQQCEQQKAGRIDTVEYVDGQSHDDLKKSFRPSTTDSKIPASSVRTMLDSFTITG